MNRYWVIQLDTKLFCPQSAFAYFLTSLGMEFCFTWCVGGGLVTFRHRDSICRPRWFSVRAEQLTSAVRRQRPRNVWAGWQLPSSAQWRQRKYSPRRIAVQIEWGRVCRACRMMPAPLKHLEVPFCHYYVIRRIQEGVRCLEAWLDTFWTKWLKSIFLY